MTSVRTSQVAIALWGTVVMALSWSAPVRADIVLGDPSLPPGSGAYGAAAALNFPYLSTPGVLEDFSHFAFTNVVRTPSGPNEIESFDALATGQLTSPIVTPLALMGTSVTLVLNKIGNPTGTFQTEMLAMNLAGGQLMLRESPTLPSLGQTTIQDLGGGLFQISSFFDVFTEISFDGGQSWIPSDGATRLTLTPEPGTLVLTGFAAAMLAGWRRRQIRTEA